MTGQPGDDVLVVNQLSVAFAGRRVLDEVSFALSPGEFCGLIGANGSGKTTLLRTILGFESPQQGSIRIAAARRQDAIGYVPQKLVLDPAMPLRARDVVELGIDGHRRGLPLPSKARRRVVDDMLRAVDATGFADQRVGSLSGGQQQRVLIAHALVRRPRLLLLDEPLANLDMRSASEIVALLQRLSTTQQVTILLSAHDMNPLLRVMDRIVYLARGRAASGRADDVVRTEVLTALYGYHIDVVRVHGRVIVVAAEGESEVRAAMAREPAHVAEVP